MIASEHGQSMRCGLLWHAVPRWAVYGHADGLKSFRKPYGSRAFLLLACVYTGPLSTACRKSIKPADIWPQAGPCTLVPGLRCTAGPIAPEAGRKAAPGRSNHRPKNTALLSYIGFRFLGFPGLLSGTGPGRLYHRNNNRFIFFETVP